MEKSKKYTVYKITNKINNMIYIGRHVTTNINDKYMGSGVQIIKAIKQYGLENFEKIVLHQFDNEIDMVNKELELVNKEFISDSNTYNVILGGGDYITLDTVTVKDLNGDCFRVHKDDPRYLSGDLKGASSGTVLVKGENGECFRVSVDDPRYLSGELSSAVKGRTLVKDRYGNTFYINVNDPRYLSGELTLFWINRKHSDETKRKIGEKNSKHQSGKGNSQYGTCWVYNDVIKENKKIKKENLIHYLDIGWMSGRKKY